MLFFDPVLRGLFGGDSRPRARSSPTTPGIEQLIERLEELDDEATWDA